MAAYSAFAGEVSLNIIIRQAFHDRKRVCLPIVDKHGMTFQCIEPDEKLALNKLGISQPLQDSKRVLDISTLDLVLVPLLAIDQRGNRIGMGGGYYDRYFATAENTLHSRRAVLIGIAYDWQTCDNIQVNPWDIPMDGMVTEKGWTWF